jgi:hypothetical protein
VCQPQAGDSAHPLDSLPQGPPCGCRQRCRGPAVPWQFHLTASVRQYLLRGRRRPLSAAATCPTGMPARNHGCLAKPPVTRAAPKVKEMPKDPAVVREVRRLQRTGAVDTAVDSSSLMATTFCLGADCSDSSRTDQVERTCSHGMIAAQRYSRVRSARTLTTPRAYRRTPQAHARIFAPRSV